jgi:hypothetical protein
MSSAPADTDMLSPSQDHQVVLVYYSSFGELGIRRFLLLEISIAWKMMTQES